MGGEDGERETEAAVFLQQDYSNWDIEKLCTIIKYTQQSQTPVLEVQECEASHRARAKPNLI